MVPPYLYITLSLVNPHIFLFLVSFSAAFIYCMGREVCCITALNTALQKRIFLDDFWLPCAESMAVGLEVIVALISIVEIDPLAKFSISSNFN